MTAEYSDERRSFLKTIAVLSGAAATLSGAQKAIAHRKPPLLLPEKPTESQGYQETDHIKKYYQSARI